jgi:cytochrome c oxidase subunit 2
MDDLGCPEVTLKVVGRQWYWSYEYCDCQALPPLQFDAMLVQEEDLDVGDLRLFETDSRVVLPTRTDLRILVTSADVLHSWAVPALGIKIDACPGRLNQVSTYLKREGVFFGQCSELCGIHHGFMPIVIQAVDYQYWLEVVWVLRAGTSAAGPASP